MENYRKATTDKHIAVIAAICTAALTAWLECADPNNPSDSPGTTPPPPHAYTLTTSRSPTHGGTVTRTPNKTSYTAGDTVTITATPTTGYFFAGWTGTKTTTNTNVIVIMDANKAITANFTTTPPPSDSIATILPNDSVATTPPPEDSVATIPPNDSVATTPPSDSVATTPKAYTISVNIIPKKGGGWVTLEPDLPEYNPGTKVTAKASAADSYTFAGWTGSSSAKSASITLTMNEHKSITANFSPRYKITTSASPSGGGTITRTPNHDLYDSGSVVTITATPKDKYNFAGWTGTITTPSNAITITSVDRNMTLTAKFTALYTFNTATADDCCGTVTLSPALDTYESGSTVTATATAIASHYFTKWSGASTDTTPTVTIAMTGNKTLTAHFAPRIILTSSTSPQTVGSITFQPDIPRYDSPRYPHKKYTYHLPGATVTATAIPTTGYVFCWWTQDGPPIITLSNPVISINMSRNTEIIAYFGIPDKPITSVVINGQTWMAENLQSPVSNIWCPDGDIANCNTYGKLYNWKSALSACPTGWHLPSNREWQALVTFVGGNKIAGKKLKSKSGWNDNGNGTDDYGFTALPGGTSNGHVGTWGSWWASDGNSSVASGWVVTNLADSIFNGTMTLTVGSSVRCIKD